MNRNLAKKAHKFFNNDLGYGNRCCSTQSTITDIRKDSVSFHCNICQKNRILLVKLPIKC